jgi:hypothetical protein
VKNISVHNILAPYNLVSAGLEVFQFSYVGSPDDHRNYRRPEVLVCVSSSGVRARTTDEDLGHTRLTDVLTAFGPSFSLLLARSTRVTHLSAPTHVLVCSPSTSTLVHTCTRWLWPLPSPPADTPILRRRSYRWSCRPLALLARSPVAPMLLLLLGSPDIVSSVFPISWWHVIATVAMDLFMDAMLVVDLKFPHLRYYRGAPNPNSMYLAIRLHSSSISTPLSLHCMSVYLDLEPPA